MLYISTVEDGTLAVGSTLNAQPINGSWDRFLSELSFVQSYGDPHDAQSSNFDGYLALTGGDGSLVLAGKVTYHDRQVQQIGGWFAV